MSFFKINAKVGGDINGNDLKFSSSTDKSITLKTSDGTIVTLQLNVVKGKSGYFNVVIVASPTNAGLVTGLCGNFNGDGNDCKTTGDCDALVADSENMFVNSQVMLSRLAAANKCTASANVAKCSDPSSVLAEHITATTTMRTATTVRLTTSASSSVTFLTTKPSVLTETATAKPVATQLS